MIRRWIVSVIAMLAALAAGIALGGGPLSDVGDTPSDAAPPPVKVTKDARVDARASLEQGFPGGVATGLYAGRLSGHRRHDRALNEVVDIAILRPVAGGLAVEPSRPGARTGSKLDVAAHFAVTFVEINSPIHVAGSGFITGSKRAIDSVQQLEQILRTLPQRPQVERVSTAATIDTIEQRIQ